MTDVIEFLVENKQRELLEVVLNEMQKNKTVVVKETTGNPLSPPKPTFPPYTIMSSSTANGKLGGTMVGL
jgi:hypothetical protein